MTTAGFSLRGQAEILKQEIYLEAIWKICQEVFFTKKGTKTGRSNSNSCLNLIKKEIFSTRGEYGVLTLQHMLQYQLIHF